MTEPASQNSGASDPVTPILEARQCRVLGVLVEKAKTTPDIYPMSLSALVGGCNQKSNRDPVVQYDPEDVEETLDQLIALGAVVRVEGSGRVEKWRHLLYDWMGVTKVELAVMAELLLRGAQTTGDLRSRVSRMDPIPDQATLQELLRALQEKGLVAVLTPPEQKRGVVVTHTFVGHDQLQKLRERYSSSAGTAVRTVGPAPPSEGLVEELRGQLDALTRRVEQLERLVAQERDPHERDGDRPSD